LLSAIQADNIRFALAATGFDRLRLRKRGLSMLTAKNKVEEWPYHPNPQEKVTISIVQAEESKVLRLFCRRCLALVELCLLAASGKPVSNIFQNRNGVRILHGPGTTGPHP
jgi:hypothetical protein